MSLVKYTSIKIKENNEPMVDLAKYGFIIEPKYFKQKLSSESRLFLREKTAEKLAKIQKSIKPLKLKIWDAFRSRDVQNNIYQKFYKEIKSAHPNWTEEMIKLETGKFVSHPYQKDRIPPHATGGTIDLTLVDKNGKELDMGTKFDDFGKESQPFYFEIYRNKKAITKNRKILREAMLKENFTFDEDEWWHFDYGNQMWALKTGKPFAIYGETTDSLKTKPTQ
ncbi:MAG: M15 family metallopeptidase [Candidatus Gracilibacteria bacterium]|jgi:D-alanyl-D-alanine dipeptidase